MALRIANKLRFIARSFTTANELVFRNATAKEADLITRRAIQEGWHVGPYDFSSILAFDPKSYYLGEVDGEVAAHIGVIEYAKHHYHGGGVIVAEKFRKNRYGVECVLKGMEVCDPNYTIGTDINLDSKSKYESLGYKKYWDTYVAMLSLEKIAKRLATSSATATSVMVKPIHNVNIDKLLEYDQTVFGTSRDILLRRWAKLPGNLSWVAIDERSNMILGYAIIKQVIRGGGTEIGLAMAPLYADNVQIAKLLLKTAAEHCLANEAVPKTKLELFHPVGDNCGEGAAELMDELEAELTHIAYRMYSKGIPPGRQMKRIYGIAAPNCD